MTRIEEFDKYMLVDSEFDKLTDEGLSSARGIKPTEDISYTEADENMINVLRQSTDESFGIEYIYDHINEETRLNLLGEDDDDIIFEDFIDNNPVNYGGETDPMKNLSIDGKYVGAGEVKFSNDVWHEMKLYSEYDSEPFRRILKNITEDGQSDVSVSLQYTMELLEDNEWDKRYPIVYMIMRLFFVTPIISLMYISAITLILISMISIFFTRSILGWASSGRGSASKWFGKINSGLMSVPLGTQTLKSMIREFIMYQFETINIMTGYHRNDFINEYKEEKAIAEDKDKKRSPIYGFGESIESLFTGYADPTDTIKAKKYDDEEYANALGGIISEIERKVGIEDDTDNKAYATTFRFVAVGEDKEEVKDKIESIKKDIESTYSPTSDKNQGGLEVRIAESREKIKDIIIDMTERKTARDENDNIVDDYRFRSAHVRRNDPIIVTPRELVSFIHMPSEEMIDSTVVMGDESVGGGVEEGGIFDEDDL